MPKLNLKRDVLAKLLQGNQLAIVSFERVLKDVGETLPDAIEEANSLAGAALAVAQVNGQLLAMLADVLEQLESAPANPPFVDADDFAPPPAWPRAEEDPAPATTPHVDPDDLAPRVHLGTISSQDADQVAISGGTVDGTPIGQSKPDKGSFTTLSASDQITSTVPNGTAPLVVASSTQVLNLNASKLAGGTWTEPGAIGFTTPSTGKFTTLSTIGACTFGAGDFALPVHVNGDTIVGATVAIFNGGGLKVALGNRSAIVGGVYDPAAYLWSQGPLYTSGALQVAGAWACNGKSAQTSYALGPAATDAATTLTLVNNIRAALIANGIGA